LALVCFDDIEYASRLYPFLTVMEQPAETFGTLGTQLLLEGVQGRAPERTRVVVLPAEFVVRVSCGASQQTWARSAASRAADQSGTWRSRPRRASPPRARRSRRRR